MNRSDDVAASDLAQLGYCERQVAFDAEHGKAHAPAQQAARTRGLKAHASFYREGRQRTADETERKGRCFIATIALGEGEETRMLRAYRDLVLRRTPAGRQLISAYYRLAPSVGRCLERSHLMRSAARRVLVGLAIGAGRVVRAQLKVEDER